MIRRPLDKRFGDKVRDGRKVTTIRAKEWPQMIPIMLYHWTGAPYRSKQEDVCVVKVSSVVPIRLVHEGDRVVWSISAENLCSMDYMKLVARELWQAEGFDSWEDMQRWFMPKMKDGEIMDMWLHFFSVHGKAVEK